jgi:hypothetical protein
MKNLAGITTHTVQPPSGRRRQVFGEVPVTPFQVDPDWYQRYWLDEDPGCVQASLRRARIGKAAKRILRMFRPMGNSRSASVAAAVRIVAPRDRWVMRWFAPLLG